MTRLWDLKGGLDEGVLAYTAGEDHALDDRLVAFDVRASRAHAVMLAAGGYLRQEELAALEGALEEVGTAHARGEWWVSLAEEDCHTAIENRLVERLGEVGKRIHLGRSRNDQVLAALRLWLKEALLTLTAEVQALATVLRELARRHGQLALPGYTHLQRAMPSTVGLWLEGFAAELEDDAEGLAAARRRADRNPLGSAAGYGTAGLRLDREVTTRLLGFAAVHEPVTAVQLSRGKAEAAALFEAVMTARDCGRLAADICLFATAEFGFVRVPPEVSTGSSMLPGKRNPDVFELIRGRSAEAEAALMEVVAISSRLPSGYHRDLQLLKKPLFRGLDGVRATLAVLINVLPRLEFDAERMAAAVDSSCRRVEEAYRLVAEAGLPFRDAYRQIANAGGDRIGEEV